MAVIDCDATKEELEATDIDIGRDSNHQDSYWLLVWPKVIVLDNTFFLGNEADVEVHHNPMEIEAEEEGNTFGTKMHGMAVWWRISEIGGRKVKEGQRKVDPKQLYKA